MRKIITAIILIGVSISAQAIKPISGWYWNPSEPGTGINLEISERADGTSSIFVAAFWYDEAGNATWYTWSGDYTEAGTLDWKAGNPIGSMSGQVFESTGGPCVQCPFQSPTTTASDLGTAVMSFLDNRNVELNWGGVMTTLRHFDFNNGFAPNADFLDSNWEIYSRIGFYYLGTVTFTREDDLPVITPFFGDDIYYRMTASSSPDVLNYVIYSPSQNQFILAEYSEAAQDFGFGANEQFYTRLFVYDQEIIGYLINTDDLGSDLNQFYQVYMRKPLPDPVEQFSIPIPYDLLNN